MWSAASSSSVSPHTHHYDTLLPPQTSSTSQPSLGQTQTSRLRHSLHLHIRLELKKKLCDPPRRLHRSTFSQRALHFDQTASHQKRYFSSVGVGVGRAGFEGGECWSIPAPPSPLQKIDCFCFQVSQKKLFFVSTSKNCHNSLVCPVGLWSCVRHPEGKKEILTKINKNWSMFSLFLGSYFFFFLSSAVNRTSCDSVLILSCICGVTFLLSVKIFDKCHAPACAMLTILSVEKKEKRKTGSDFCCWDEHQKS